MTHGRRMEIRDLSFSYPGRQALSGISLTIGEGEIVGIVGPNGSGKSTLLKAMAGIFPPASGSVSLGGAPLAAMKPRERAQSIAFVPQESGTPFSYRALEVVLMGRAPHLPAFGFESARDVAIARGAMEKTDSLQFAQRPIDELSGGERQRVIIARALAQESPILILDEPTAALDIRHQSGLHAILAEENRARGTTIVAAMHDLNLAAAFCGRIVMLRDGCIAADGTPEELFTAETIGRVFDAEVIVGRDEGSGRSYCLPRG